MTVCSVVNCPNTSRQKGLRFFKFPNELTRRKIWMTRSGLENDPGPSAKLCAIHFEENQFELHRQDGWKKLKPNAVPTVFPEPSESSKQKKEKSPRKRKIALSEDGADVIPKKKYVRKKNLVRKEKFPRKRNLKKKSKSLVQKKKLVVSFNKQSSSDISQNSQKENVSPKLRKSKRPSKFIIPDDSKTYDEETYVVMEPEESEAQKQIESLKKENNSMKQEILEFEKHNKAMACVILELEKHNKLMSMKLGEFDKENKVLTKRVGDLEKQNEDLKSILSRTFSEEQLARMDLMKQLGTIERYIPVSNFK